MPEIRLLHQAAATKTLNKLNVLLYVILCLHLTRQHLPDANARAAKHLGHFLHGVHSEADSGPDVRSNVWPEPYVRFQEQAVVTVTVKVQSILIPATDCQEQRGPAGRTEREDAWLLTISEVTQTHGHTCRGQCSQCQI